MAKCCRALLCGAMGFFFAGAALAGTSVGQPFPSDLLTVADPRQVTGIRVELPKPDCSTNPFDCADVAILNKLDGFNIQPRISVPFSGAIDVNTVSSSTIFLVGPDEHVVGINQAEWEPATNTLHFESDEQLAPASTYLLVVTTGVHAADGSALDLTSFRHDLNYGQTKDSAEKAYRKALLDSLELAAAGGASPGNIAGASLFTTQSIDAISKKMRAQLQAAPASFTLGTNGERTVFPVASVAAIPLMIYTKAGQ